MIEAFVFDMDRILLDTESVCDRTWQIAGKEFGVSEEDSLKIVNLCRGTNKSDTRDIIRRELGESFDVEGFLKRTSECFVDIEKNEGIRVMPYARECLQFLKNSGYRLALASSTREVIVRKHLQAAELLDFFEVIVTGDMVVHSKPDPEIYLKACSEIGIQPVNCVAVEDSPNGLKSASLAGMVTVMIPDRISPNEETEKVTDYLFDSLNGIILARW